MTSLSISFNWASGNGGNGKRKRKIEAEIGNGKAEIGKWSSTFVALKSNSQAHHGSIVIYCTKPEVVRLVGIGYSVILYLVVYCLIVILFSIQHRNRPNRVLEHSRMA